MLGEEEDYLSCGSGEDEEPLLCDEDGGQESREEDDVYDSLCNDKKSVLDEAFLSNLREDNFEKEGRKEEHVDFLIIDIQVQHDLDYGTCVVLFGRATDGR
jgi:hypothetical protein